MIAVLYVIAFAVSFSAGQSGSPVRDSGGNDLLSCSPAPCVLPPVAATVGGFDAPIIADPTNSSHLIVGISNDIGCPAQVDTGFSLSTDGGATWSLLVCMEDYFSDGQEYSPGGQPVLGYDRKGVAYVAGFYLDDNGRTSFGFEGFEKSSDGTTWSTPAPAVIRQNYVPNYCWMAVDDSAASPYADSVYVSCVMIALKAPYTDQVVVTHSNDGGATWKQVAVAPPQNSGLAEDLNTGLTIGADGTVYATWMYCYSNPHECSNGTKGYQVFSKSSDGGNTWSKPTLVAIVSLHSIPNTFIGVPDTPAVAVDNSTGAHAGDLYVAMYNWTGTFMQVQVLRSTDGGTTWSKPVPVAPGITHDQFLPWISVSPTGLVGVSWLDRRNDPANVNYQAFGAISTNGGVTFQPNVALTSGFSNPTIEGSTIGNYTGNTWNGPNYFVAAWMDSSNGGDMQEEVGGIRLK